MKRGKKNIVYTHRAHKHAPRSKQLYRGGKKGKGRPGAHGTKRVGVGAGDDFTRRRRKTAKSLVRGDKLKRAFMVETLGDGLTTPIFQVGSTGRRWSSSISQSEIVNLGVDK